MTGRHDEYGYRHGCRCDRCRAAWADYKRALRRRNGAVPLDQWREMMRGRTHGVRSTYTHGCRCDQCRQAERLYRAAYRRAGGT